MDGLDTRGLRPRRPGQEGLTLIELLVVITVLAVLAVIVIFNVVAVANGGKAAACSIDVKSAQAASDAHNQHTGMYPRAGTVDMSRLAQRYIHTPPVNSASYNTVDATGTVTSADVGVGTDHLDGC